MFFIVFYRLFFFITTILVGRIILLQLGMPNLWASITALGVSLFFVAIEHFIARKKPREVLTALTGLATALLVSNGLAFLVTRAEILKPVQFWVYIFANLVGLYVIGGYIYRRRDKLTFLDIFMRTSPAETLVKVVDTSALIDARILDVAKTGFLEGTLVVPRFVLRELQRIADSREHARRVKGRRGLDVLRELQKIKGIQVTIHPEDFPDLKSVDHKLLELCRTMGAKLLTVDFNLKKLAEVQGIQVLNVNQLATVLKPPITQGEEIQVKITKPGKEEGQGVGYLEDGTMVVVENAESMIGETIQCTVQAFLQTEAGRIVFARPKKTTSV